MITPDAPRRVPSSVIWAGIAGWIGSVCLLDFSSIYGRLNADAFIPVMVSLERWTPFFWTQDYYGMLIPLLLRPIHSPLHNLMLNEALSFIASLASIFLICGYFTSWRFATVLGCLVIAALLGLWPHCAYDYIASEQFPQTALAFGLSAILLLDSDGKPRTISRLSLAVLLMLIGCWINWSMPSLLLLMIGVRTVVQNQRPSHAGTLHHRIKAAVPSALLACTGLGFGVTLMKLYGVPRYESGFLSSDVWINSWDTLFVATENAWAADHIRVVLSASLLIALPTYLLIPPLRRSLAHSWRPAAAMALVGICYALPVGTQQWTAHERYAARFWYPMNLLMIISITSLCLLPLVRVLKSNQLIWASWLSVGVVWSAIVFQYGRPSMGNVRNSLAKSCGAFAGEIDAEHCTHVMGSYWQVWPSVMYVKILRSDRGDPTPIWAITYRGEWLRDRWFDYGMENWRIAVTPDNPEYALARIAPENALPPLVKIADRSAISVWRAKR